MRTTSMKNDQSNEQREGGDQFKRCIERKCLRKEYLFMIDNSHANVAEKTISYRNNFIDTLYDVAT